MFWGKCELRCVRNWSVAKPTVCSLLLVAGACLSPASAIALGTAAGTTIINVAHATYTDGASLPQSVTSNAVSIRVEEIIDVVVSTVGAQPVAVLSGDTGRMMTFRVTNSGNGPENYSLLGNPLIGGDQFDPSLVRIVLDSDGDGTFDPLNDQIYAPGGEPLIGADGSIDIFLFVNIPGSATNGDQGLLTLTASATTGSGTPGTLFPGAGQGGSDAILGAASGTSSATATALVTSDLPTLAKSYVIGGDGLPTKGARITYTIIANLGGSAVTSPVVTDPIPQGTHYVPGSLMLDGAALSDADDSDAGHFTGSAVAVALPGSGGGPQSINFQVEIN